MNKISKIIAESIKVTAENEENVDIDSDEVENYLMENYDEGDEFTIDDIAEDIGEIAGGFIHPSEIAAILDDLVDDGMLEKDGDTFTYLGD